MQGKKLLALRTHNITHFGYVKIRIIHFLSVRVTFKLRRSINAIQPSKIEIILEFMCLFTTNVNNDNIEKVVWAQQLEKRELRYAENYTLDLFDALANIQEHLNSLFSALAMGRKNLSYVRAHTM